MRKEEPLHTTKYLEVLAHYGAELVQGDGRIMVIRSQTGAELRFEEKAKTLMVRQLLEEFGSIDGTNEAVKEYKTTRN